MRWRRCNIASVRIAGRSMKWCPGVGAVLDQSPYLLKVINVLYNRYTSKVSKTVDMPETQSP